MHFYTDMITFITEDGANLKRMASRKFFRHTDLPKGDMGSNFVHNMQVLLK